MNNSQLVIVARHSSIARSRGVASPGRWLGPLVYFALLTEPTS